MLSGLNIITALKGRSIGFSGNVLRKGLSLLQLIISSLLIIGAITMYRQFKLISQQDLGFEPSQTVMIPLRTVRDSTKIARFKQLLSGDPNIQFVSASSGIPGVNYLSDSWPVIPDNRESAKQPVLAIMADTDYKNVLGLKMAAGRYFLKEISSDYTSSFVINETAVEALGFLSPEEAVGKSLLWVPSEKRGTIIGVVKDFNYRSLHTKIEPSIIHMYADRYACVTVKFLSSIDKNSMAAIESQWRSVFPDKPFEYKYVEDIWDILYQKDRAFSTVMYTFTGIAVLIAAIGLLAMITFSLERRTKEIGIRKVLGASVNRLMTLLFKESLIISAIAFIAAYPLAWFLMNKWLENFAYRAEWNLSLFFISGILSIALVFAILAFQIYRAVNVNPTESLKYE